MKFIVTIYLLTCQLILQKCEPEEQNKNSDADSSYVSFDQKNIFEKWMRDHHKSYENSNKTKKQALKIFYANYADIESHNSRSNETYRRSVTEYSDLTLKEKRKFRLGLNASRLSTRSLIPIPVEIFNKNSTSRTLNYTKYFPPAKDQFYCGSCYSFAAISIVEYHSRKYRNSSVTYSEQEIVDCDQNSHGCRGGWPTVALNYIRDEGIANGSTYVYEGTNTTCQKEEHPSIHRIQEVCEVSVEDNEENLKKLLDNVGPVASVIAISEGFYDYASGVYYDPNCDSNAFDHAITIVGYGTHRAYGDYWIIRNSWGVSWGKQGYAWVARNRNNTACGLAKYAMYIC